MIWKCYYSSSCIPRIPKIARLLFCVYTNKRTRKKFAWQIRYLIGDNFVGEKWRKFGEVTKIFPDKIFPSKVTETELQRKTFIVKKSTCEAGETASKNRLTQVKIRARSEIIANRSRKDLLTLVVLYFWGTFFSVVIDFDLLHDVLWRGFGACS